MVVVRCAKGTETAEPVTMADFGDVLDFFAWFGSRFQNPLMRPLLARFPVPAAQQPEVVAGVVVHCEAMVSMKNSPSRESIVTCRYGMQQGIFRMQEWEYRHAYSQYRKALPEQREAFSGLKTTYNNKDHGLP